MVVVSRKGNDNDARDWQENDEEDGISDIDIKCCDELSRWQPLGT